MTHKWPDADPQVAVVLTYLLALVVGLLVGFVLGRWGL